MRARVRIGVMLSLLFAAAVQSSAEPAVIPRPQSMQTLSGDPFVFGKGTVILAPQYTPTIKFVSELVMECTDDLPRIVRAVVGGSGGPVVSVKRDAALKPEWYRLRAEGKSLEIEYGDEAGLFYAIQTVRQLMPMPGQSVAGAAPHVWSVPPVLIEDGPRFSWRGMHLDVSRHFFPVSFIKRFIDYAAMHKMNVFHWHLIDDGGWRMEVKKFPMLTAVGGWRAGNAGEWSYSDIRFLFDDAKPRYGGFYTQGEIKQIVKYAQDRFVTVVPEIEMPGHTTPSIVVYPDLGCDGVAPPTERGRTSTNVYCAGKEGTFAFLEDVLRETMELFPSKWIHIGGDEVYKGHWAQCASCQKRMADEGLKNVDELQSYFIRRIEKFLVANGRRLVGWDEILEGGLAPEATVMSWRGVEGGIAAAKAGHDVVMSPTSHCYFDYSYATTPTQHVYGWEPVPTELTTEEAKHVLGGQGNVWTEWIPTVELCEYMIFPRMLATAEVLWTNKDRRDWDGFSSRLSHYFARLDAMAVSYHIPAPQVEATAAVFETRATVAATVPEGSPFTLRYTTDGSAPGVFSREYTGPLTVEQSSVVSFALVSRAGNVGEVVRVECIKASPRSAAGLVPGVVCESFEGKWERLPDFGALTAARTTNVASIGLEPRTRDDEFGLRFVGFFRASAEGVYRFRLGSDDGSRLRIAGATVVDNDGLHGYVVREGSVRLAAGVYAFELAFFEAGGAERLTLEMQAPGGTWGAADAALLRARD